MQLDGAKVLVVGATGVLGGRIAEALSGAGARLVLTGRDADRLADRGKELDAVGTYALDVVETDAAGRVVDEAAEALGGLDAVVVASGIAAFGPAAETPDAVAEELLTVNTLGPIAITRAALGRLGEGGALAVVSAVLADTPTAGMAAYSASKAAVSAYLAAVRREVRRQGVSVLDIRPPHMDTGLVDRAIAGEAPKLPAGHDVDEVVRLVVEGIRDGRRELAYDATERSVTLR